MWAKVALRLFWRELRNGELWVIAFALMLAVFSVVSLTGITESIRQALLQRSSSFNAADLVLRSGTGFAEPIFNQASAAGLRSARQLQFNTMLFAGDVMQLVNVKAVSDSYPLRGKLQLVDQSGQLSSRVEAGKVYLEPRLQQLLNVRIGDTLEIGATRLLVGGLIQNEPDAPLNLFGGQPRLLMQLEDAAATGAIAPGSRLSYRSLFAGGDAELQGFKTAVTPQLGPNDRWQQLDRQSSVGAAVDRAEQFMLLAGLLGIVLASAAAAVGASRYSQRHQMAVAVIKALGATSVMAQRIYFSHLLLLTGLASLVGIVAGSLCHQGVIWLLAGWFPEFQPVFSGRPLWMGLATALLCALLFSARPLWRLTRVPAISVLRSQQPAWQADWWQLLTGSVAVILLMWLFSRDWWLSLSLYAACAMLALVLMGMAALLVKLARPMAAGQSSALRLALANLRRRLWQNSFQLMTFSLALFLTLVLFYLRTELLSQWQQQVPPDAPNHFLVNITEAEKPAIAQGLAAQQITLGRFYPMISGRVLAVNQESLIEPDDGDKTTAAAQNADNRPRRQGFGRELNLSWFSELPPANEITAGQWFSKDSKGEVSVEQEQAERLQLKIGDQISFAIGGERFEARVTSFRKVDWNSLQPNFFMILSPDLMQRFPAVYLTAFYLPASGQQAFTELVRQYPTVSVISVADILAQVNAIIDQVSLALTFILLLVFAAALLVLTAQTQASVEQRQQELAILRTLGAKGAFLRQAVLYEFAALGLLAGIFATLLTEILLAMVQVRLFNLPFALHTSLWGLGPVSGGLLLTGLSVLLLGRILKPAPALVIRRALTG